MQYHSLVCVVQPGNETSLVCVVQPGNETSLVCVMHVMQMGMRLGIACLTC